MSGVRVTSVGLVSGWRKTRPGRTLKLAYILETKQFADVTFRVGNVNNNEIFPAHKLVLSMYSSVFEAMFQGPLAVVNDDIIEIPDIEPQSFQVILKFVYSGEFEKDMAVENALGVLYGAKKYDISDLELVCTDYLKNQISAGNVVSIFQTAQLLDELPLKEETYGYIIRNFGNVSSADDFLNITKDNLCLILNDDDTRGAELDIFFGVVRWTAAECARQGLEVTPDNQRRNLEGILKHIRFPIMTSEDIALQVVPLGVLTPEESTLLFQHMVVPHESRDLLPELPFSSKKRNCSTYIAKFYDGMAKTAYVDISAGWFNKFSVDQPVSIVSYGFYGPHSCEAASYDISIKLTRDSADSVIAEVGPQTVIAKMREVFHVKFQKAVPIYPGNNYRAWFSLKGPLTCHGTSTTSTQEVIVPVNFTRYGHVKFTYTVTGAHQLPEIGFEI